MNEINGQKTFFIRAEDCTGCGICQIACSLAREAEVNPARARVSIERKVMDGLMLPHVCLNCKQPPCIAACRRKALSKDPFWLRNISNGARPIWNLLTVNALAVFGLTTYLLTFAFWLR